MVLFSSYPSNNFAAPYSLVEIPGQVLACTHDLNRGAKTGHTSTKIAAHSTATKKVSGSPARGLRCLGHAKHDFAVRPCRSRPTGRQPMNPRQVPGDVL